MNIFSSDVDIFLKCLFDCPPMKKMILEEFFYTMQKLENFNILEVPTQVASEVADVAAATANMGIKVEWIGKVLGVIGTKKNHYALFQEA